MAKPRYTSGEPPRVGDLVRLRVESDPPLGKESVQVLRDDKILVHDRWWTPTDFVLCASSDYASGEAPMVGDVICPLTDCGFSQSLARANETGVVLAVHGRKLELPGSKFGVPGMYVLVRRATP